MRKLQSAGKESGTDREPSCGTPLLPGQAHVGDSWWRPETGTEANARLKGILANARTSDGMEFPLSDRAPKPQCPIHPSWKKSVQKGASLDLTANGPEAQPGECYQWMHNGTEVKSRECLSVDGRTLRFSPVTQADGGIWVCYLNRQGHKEVDARYLVEISGGSCISCFERMAAFLSRQAMLLSLLALVFLLILAAIGLIYQRNKINQLDQSYNSLRANNSQLDRDYYSLHGNCSLLNQSYNEMREKNKQLDREHNKTLDGVRRLFNTLIERGCDPCPTDWKLFNGTCYFFSKDEGDWHSANDSCITDNATLAIVNSPGRQNFIADHDDDKRWIGLTDLEGVHVFRWLNGDLLNTGYWADGEPNERGLERCVTKGTQYDPVKWNTDLCTTPHRWICEIPSYQSLAREFGLEMVLDQESGET